MATVITLPKDKNGKLPTGTKFVAGRYKFTDGKMTVEKDEDANKMMKTLGRFYGCTKSVTSTKPADSSGSKDDASMSKDSTKQ